MVRLSKRISKKAGLPPGTPVHVGEKKTDKVRISVINYDKENYEMREMQAVEECIVYKGKPSITWVNVCGLHEVDVIEKLCGCFDIHLLTAEDILNTEQRLKIEMFEKYIYLVMKMISYNVKNRGIDVEQMSLILGDNYVITFQEREGDVFNDLRNRIQHNKGRIRKAGADYLAYSLIDSVIDNYFVVLEKIGEEVEVVEDELITRPEHQTIQKIHFLRREMIFLRKAVWPLREIINNLEHDDSPLIRKETVIYIRDLYDHTVQIIDGVETYREIISGMLDIYLSSISNRMNEIMKVLTMVAVIFIPLTLIAGIYGMNFNTMESPFNMPELNWYFGYPFALGLMAVVSIVMLIFFKRKRWM